MGYSSLVDYVRLSPNHSGERRYPITRITPHYASGNVSIETLGDIFAPPERQASSQYGVGSDGRVGLYVDEDNRAWTSGSYDNDNRAVTIECANLDDGSLTDECWNALVALCADICQRNGKTRLVYTGEVSDVGSADMLLTMHKWFQSTDCPGPWLSNQFDRLAREVNERLGTEEPDELHGWAQSLDECRDAADYAYCTCAVYSCGYSQNDRENISIQRLNDGTAETDCSAGVAWWLHMGGLLDELYFFWTAIEIDYLVSKGYALLPASVAPRRNDVLWRQGHTALYIGDGMQAEALWSEDHSYDGAPGDQTGGETIVREYPAGVWTYILRPPAKETIDLEDEMICVFRPNGDEKQPLCYYDGSKVHPIADPDELESVCMVYKQTHNGKDIPIFDLGAPTAPYATRFINLTQRDW